MYKKISKGADFVFFIFDIKRFMSDKDYKLQTRARLQYVGDGMGVSINKQVVIASHADKLSDVNSAKNYAIENLRDVYSNILENLIPADVRRHDDVIKILERKLV